MQRLLLFLALSVAHPETRAATTSPAAREARALYTQAMKRVARDTPAQRMRALLELEQAALFDPGRLEYAIAAGRLCLRADRLHDARAWGAKVLERDSANADAHALIGSAWRRDWLATADDVSLDRALKHSARAALLRRGDCGHWMALLPLLLERDEIAGARGAAEMAWEADSTRADTWLARACALQRSGDLERAESAFAEALARLPTALRARFEDPAPLMSSAALRVLLRMPVTQRAAELRRFWAEIDPNPVTPINEARLELLARAVQAYLLYFNAETGFWDARGDLFIRFGHPRWIDRNPLFHDAPASLSKGSWLVWTYPEFGMRLWLYAMHPQGSYRLPESPGRPLRPFPDSLSRHPEWVGVGSAVFPTITPGVSGRALRGTFARFEGDSGRRLLAHVECAGLPTDSLRVEWVVQDSSYREVARGAERMSPSACAPAEFRAASFTADLPAGRYRVGTSVGDGRGCLGVLKESVLIADRADGIAMSDIVVTCGSPQTGFTRGEPLRLEPDPRRRVVADAPLTAYFEVYHLTPGADGWSRYEQAYTVRSVGKDPRVWIQRALSPRRDPTPIEVRREEETSGSLRRQFVSVPVRTLPAGEYEIEIEVRDLQSGAKAVGRARFVRAS